MNKMTVWDISHDAGITPVTLVSYDGDKYCTLYDPITNETYTRKSGYLFSTKERAIKADEWFSSYDGAAHCPRSIVPYKYMLTRKEYAKHRKERYKKKVSYCLEDDSGNQVPFVTLSKAVEAFNKLAKVGSFYLVELTKRYCDAYNSSRVLVARENDNILFYSLRHSKNSRIKFPRIKE